MVFIRRRQRGIRREANGRMGETSHARIRCPGRSRTSDDFQLTEQFYFHIPRRERLSF